MRVLFSLLLLLLCFSHSVAQVDNSVQDTLKLAGNDNKTSDFFKMRYLSNDLVNYLDNYSDYVVYESETTGLFNLPDIMLFSVSGNSYKWNKFYVDGFRVDSRFFAGSTFFHPDMSIYSLNLGSSHSDLNFSSQSSIQPSLAFSYNVGGLGGISSFTQDLIQLFHTTATQRAYKPFVYRQNMKGASTLNLNYSIAKNHKIYNQQLYADAGTRMLVGFDDTGINQYYPESFFQAQLSGELPVESGTLFDHTHYLCNFSQRDYLYSEFNFSKDESASSHSSSFSVYGTKKINLLNYSSGFTLAFNKIKHQTPNFSRNVIDQDGDGFEPWYPDGTTAELSHAIRLNRKISSFLELNFDGFNSLLSFNPLQHTSQNPVYAQNLANALNPIMPYSSLYIYNWTSNPFNSGLLENTLSLRAYKPVSKTLCFKANADLTFDGLLVSSKSLLQPNWQAEVNLLYKPFTWVSMGVNLSKSRVAFNFDDVRFLSNDYMNADIFYWNDSNNDRFFQDNEKSDYFTSTGGKYHSLAKSLKQPSYLVLDIPLLFNFGKHEISIISTYKKYYDNWTTRLDKPADQYGSFVAFDQTLKPNAYYPDGNPSIFFYNNTPVNYVVDYYSEELMGSNIFTNSPFYVSSILKYQYMSDRFLFSFSWQSHLMCGISSLGNGVLHNTLGAHSESSANPNIGYKLLGRLDQDRAYIARILLSYQLNSHLRLAATGKFKDGQPFTDFYSTMLNDASGVNKQIAIWSNRTKGINPFNGDFGSRKDAFFNVDLKAIYTGSLLSHSFEVQALLYNAFDFGTELAEYCFRPVPELGRASLSLAIPRGLMFTAKVYY